MPNPVTSEQLHTNYAGYYTGEESEWRRLGAVDKAANIVALCRDLPHASLLEIGAGDGAILAQLSQHAFGEQLFALEISASGVEAIRARGIPRLAECQLFDGYHIPYPDRRFDLAVLSHVIEHVEHPRLLLYEAARVACSVFVEVPLEDTLRLKRDFVFTKVGHINAYSPVTIRRLLQSCRLEVLRQVVVNPSLAAHRYRQGRKGAAQYALKQFMLQVFPGLAVRLFSYHSALVCRPAPLTESSPARP